MGPLDGVPVVVKEQFDCAGNPTTLGSSAISLEGAGDAEVVARLRLAGAQIVGTAVMADFGLSLFSRSSRHGFTPNPHDVRRDAGGSSAGCATAVASGRALVAVGVDSSGSVRVPASFCGVVGFRPTVGTISMRGASPVIPGQDVPGVMARRVSDVRRVFAVLRNTEAGETFPLSGARVGLYVPEVEPASQEADDVREVVKQAAAGLARAGVIVVRVPSLPEVRPTVPVGGLIRHGVTEYLKAHSGAGTLPTLGELVTVSGAADLLHLLESTPLNPIEFKAIRRAWDVDLQRRRRLWADWFRRADVHVLAYPTAGLPAPTIADLRKGRWTTQSFPFFTWGAAWAAAPAITIPVGHSAEGLPIGLEFAGLAHADDALLSWAEELEAVLRQSDW